MKLGKKKKGLLSEGYLWILLALLIYGASLGARKNPELLERVYPAEWNRALIRLLSRITGPFPFSLGEAFVYFHVFLGAVLLVLFLVRLFKGGAWTLLSRTIAYLSILYIVFMMVFGLNYQRPSVRAHLSLEKTLYEKEVLETMNQALIERANSLRERVPQDEEGVFTLSMEEGILYEKALETYEAFSWEHPVYAGTYGPAKGILLSEYMNYTGITGIFFPFTGEANVNTKGPDLLFPATVLHEMAHQRGVAYEDEANYMAYVTSLYSEEEEIRYSGTMLALISSMNALYRVDKEAYRTLYDTYSEGVKRDLSAYSAFYKPYEGKVQEQATKVNDNYLKSNGQVSGVRSYGEMVNLLLEQFVQKGRIDL
ncbi:DUF3810 domain-containing protein [Proteiniclasticum ruminis]|uniref:DUF3810 domain-containing protein n=1 Tax=Proteiniclasticum ruminis TaxID=398199 RepID=A0A1I4ZQ86_9CLOT|nr:DUF3810 domain-containing protein [Proteiniclasticum ruminis]SFN52431.1 Protein of unknown function [Proteiniclasticum ruminis]